MTAPASQTVFRSESVKIGWFRASPSHPRFRDSGPPGDHLFVFPRAGVWIEHEGRRPFVADPNVVTFYNPSQQYFRSPVSRRGDHSDWFALRLEILEAQFAAFGLPVDANGEAIYPFLSGPGDPATYLEQRRLVRRLRDGRVADPLEVEERVLDLGARVVASAARSLEVRVRKAPSARHRQLVEAARELLAARFRERLTIDAIACELAASPFHLSRVFRRLTGLTLHQYRMRLRLSNGLVDLTERPLTDLALDLGFSSHSHFTVAFRRLYGATPRAVRELLSA